MDNSNDLDGTELAAYLKEMNFTQQGIDSIMDAYTAGDGKMSKDEFAEFSVFWNDIQMPAFM